MTPTAEINDAKAPSRIDSPTGTRLVFRALLGVLLFFCGIIFGVWLIIRFRRRAAAASAPDS
jgi:preprotein translocase subunit SecF